MSKKLRSDYIYTQDELDFLMKNSEKMTQEDIAEELGRSVAGIREKIRTMKLPLKKTVRAAYSKEEVQFLRENYVTMTVKEMSEHLGRTEKGVRGKINSLGIKLESLKRQQTYKNYIWNAEELRIIELESTTFSDLDIYIENFSYLPSPNWVYRKRREMGLEGAMPYKHGEPYLNNNGYYGHYVDGETVWQHRQVAEKDIGRPLLDSERVHHINGSKADNAISNLYVCKNIGHHGDVHAQLEDVSFELVKKGVIKFSKKSGKYYIDRSKLPTRTEG